MTDDINPPEDRALFEALKAIPRPVPPPAMASEFRARTRIDSTVAHSGRRWLLVAIAALLLLAVGGAWWLKGADTARALATALRTSPAPSRVQAIASIDSMSGANGRIVSALTTALLTDSSTNVRVAAAEALGRIATPSAFRDAARRSIQNDSSPFVQAALLTAISRLPEQDRVALLRALLARTDLDPVLRAEAVRRSKT